MKYIMRRIVVVDRDPELARAVARSLEGRFDVVETPPDDALAVVASLHFDVLLCAWDLGATTARPIVEAALRRRHRPRVWLAHEERADASLVGYATSRRLTLLDKPLRPHELAARVA